MNIVVSDDCPRGEELYKRIKQNPPLRLKRMIRDKKVKVSLYSFFEKNDNPVLRRRRVNDPAYKAGLLDPNC